MKPAIGAPNKYPPTQPVTIIPIATLTLALPKTFAATVGMIEKNPPLLAPLMMQKMISGPRVSDTGQSASIEIALSSNEAKSVFSGPNLSPSTPHRIRPTAEEKLKVATKVVPIWEDKPKEAAYRGKKNGGTMIGKVAKAPARNMMKNFGSRKRFL